MLLNHYRVHNSVYVCNVYMYIYRADRSQYSTPLRINTTGACSGISCNNRGDYWSVYLTVLLVFIYYKQNVTVILSSHSAAAMGIYHCTVCIGVIYGRAGVATRYGLHGLGFEARGSQMFPTRPDRPWGSPMPLYNRYRVSLPGVKRPGRGLNHPLPPGAKVKERIELCLYSFYGPSWPVIGQTLLSLCVEVSACSMDV
jgi:hypothetical protein